MYFPRDARVHTANHYLSLSDASVGEVVGPGRVERPTYWLKASCTTIVLRTRVVSSIYHLVIPLFIALVIFFFVVESLFVGLRGPHRHAHSS